MVGKPSFLYNEHDADWVPSKNVSQLEQQKECGIDNVQDLSANSSRTPLFFILMKLSFSFQNHVMNTTLREHKNVANYRLQSDLSMHDFVGN